MEKLLRFVEKLIPRPLYRLGQPPYHYLLAWAGTVLYRSPSANLVVVGVTGTKGKSSTTELIAAILRESLGQEHVAAASTIQFSIGTKSERNLYKMTMPGRFFVQRFLRRAVDAGCTHAVLETSSEAAKQFRHKGVQYNALVFTNLAPEHIESHGSFEKYLQAKLSIAKAVANSPKRPRMLVANLDDEYGRQFLNFSVEIRAGYSLADAEPYQTDDRSIRFVWRGELFTVPLPGVFNLYNCLAALTLGEALGIEVAMMKRALEHIGTIAGRAERVEQGQPFSVVVDYAHTVESLTALYETFKNKRILAIIGATGGGRDARKRAARGALAEKYASITYITNEDPYDEDPQKIIQELAAGFTAKKPQLFLDRRIAIREALKAARAGDAVLLTGKGTDPYLMGPRGTKEPWNDAEVAREELAKLGYTP